MEKFKDADNKNTAQDNRIHPINRIKDKDSRDDNSGKNIQDNNKNKHFDDRQNNQDNRNNYNNRRNNKY